MHSEVYSMSRWFASSHGALLVIGMAVVMAFISAKVLFNGSVANVVPWGILAFTTSFLASRRREAWMFGGIFGFVVSYAFLWFDNTGTKTLGTVLILIPLIILPALFGALCGFLLAWLGWIVQRLFKTQRS
jgi:hypothetical protein